MLLLNPKILYAVVLVDSSFGGGEHVFPYFFLFTHNIDSLASSRLSVFLWVQKRYTMKCFLIECSAVAKLLFWVEIGIIIVYVLRLWFEVSYYLSSSCTVQVMDQEETQMWFVKTLEWCGAAVVIQVSLPFSLWFNWYCSLKYVHGYLLLVHF